MALQAASRPVCVLPLPRPPFFSGRSNKEGSELSFRASCGANGYKVRGKNLGGGIIRGGRGKVLYHGATGEEKEASKNVALRV